MNFFRSFWGTCCGPEVFHVLVPISSVGSVGAFSLQGDRNLQKRVQKLQRSQNDVVYVLNVIEVEQLSKTGELLLRDDVLLSEDFVGSLLRLFLRLECDDGKDDGLDVKQQSDATKDQDTGTHSVEHEIIQRRPNENQGNEGKGAEGDQGNESDPLFHIGIALFIQNGQRRLLGSHAQRG